MADPMVEVGRYERRFGAAESPEKTGGEGEAPEKGKSGETAIETCTGLEVPGDSETAVWLSDPVEASPFDWLVPWWAADISGEGFVETELQVETAKGWSAWYKLGRWSVRPQSFSAGDADGKVETDTLLLSGRSTRFRYRLSLGAPGYRGSARIRRFGVLTRDRHAPKSHGDLGKLPLSLVTSSISVPARSQMTERQQIKGRICSPTCCAMALEALGLDYPTSFVAEDCRDYGAEIYGNWPFCVASLGRLGAEARLDFFPNLEAAAAELAKGHILIASVAFRENELDGAPIKASSGHLILVRGLARREDGGFAVLVNDPASGDVSGVMREYDAAQFESVWKGVAYVVEGRRGARPAG